MESIATYEKDLCIIKLRRYLYAKYNFELFSRINRLNTNNYSML